MNNKYDNSILLIGPPNVGKGNISKALSEKTAIPYLSLDSSRDKYYAELGYDRNHATTLMHKEGFISRYKYQKNFEAHHIASILPTIQNDSIIRFESTQTVYEDKALFAKVSSEIKKYKNIILVLPETDPVQSWQSTNRSTRVPEGSDRSKLNWHLISSPCIHMNYCIVLAY